MSGARRIAWIMLACAIMAIQFPAKAAQFTYPELPDAGSALGDFVPDGWRVQSEGQGDLNKDEIADIVAVLEREEAIEHVPGCDKWRDRSNAAPRILVFLLAREGGGFRLSAENRTLIYRADEGGVLGDPFQSVRVERGAAVIEHYGGSNFRWAYTHRFRFQDGGWYLIGYTENTHHTVSREATQFDYNPLTSKVKITSAAPEGGSGCYRCFKDEPCPPHPDCSKDETRATSDVVWKTLPKRPLVSLGQAACVSILPYVPYD